MLAMWTRLIWAAVSMFLIAYFPQNGITSSYFFLVVACTVGSSFSSFVPSLLPSRLLTTRAGRSNSSASRRSIRRSLIR